MGNDSALTETPLLVKRALRRLTEIATLTEQIQSEPRLAIIRHLHMPLFYPKQA
jgi:hypothetical protein